MIATSTRPACCTNRRGGASSSSQYGFIYSEPDSSRSKPGSSAHSHTKAIGARRASSDGIGAILPRGSVGQCVFDLPNDLFGAGGAAGGRGSAAWPAVGGGAGAGPSAA